MNMIALIDVVRDLLESKDPSTIRLSSAWPT